MFTCTNCNNDITFAGSGTVEQPASKPGPKKSHIQKRIAVAASVACMDFENTHKYLVAMDLPCMSKKTFYKDCEDYRTAVAEAEEVSKNKWLQKIAIDRVIPWAAGDGSWNKRRNGGTCVFTFMARCDDGKMRIIASAATSRNNRDTPTKNSEGNWDIAAHGDQDYYGTSNAIEPFTAKRAILQINKKGYFIRRMCTDGDSKGFDTAAAARWLLETSMHDMHDG
jgi:hypothetical protein